MKLWVLFVANKTKVCTKCKKRKSIIKFSKHKNHKDGLSSQCKKCDKKYRESNFERDAATKKQWQINNPKKRIVISKRYYENNKEKIIARWKRYYENNKEKEATRQKQYRENNFEKISVKQKRYWRSSAGKLTQKRSRDKLRLTFKGKLNKNISCAINKSLKRKGTPKNGCHWETLVGFTVEKLILSLESKFEDWMNWSNYGYGKDKWCIDHKKPIASFNFNTTDDKEFKKCWALRNLQPMRCSENFSKGSKMEKMNRKPSFIKNEELSPVIDNDSVPKKGEVPEYETYEGWQELGYQVMRGEKSYHKIDGVAVFHRDQVKDMEDEDDRELYFDDPWWD